MASSTSLAGGTSRISTAQASVRIPKDPRPPLDVRASERIVPNLLRPDTSRRSLTLFAARKRAMKSDRTELGPSNGEPTSQTQEPKLDEPCRAVSYRRPRKQRCSTAPEVPSTSSPGPKTWGGNEPALVIPLLVHCSRNLCDQRPPGHDVVQALLAQPKQAW